MRRSSRTRTTGETDIAVSIALDGTGESSIQTGIAFFDHMLTSFCTHSRTDLRVGAQGDLEIDPHHTVEDIGITLGLTLREAIGEGAGIRRFASPVVPMDEARAQVALDCSGRGYLVWEGAFSAPSVGGIPVTLIEHFFYSLCINAGLTCHIVFQGRDDHHIAEAIFKAFAVALREAVIIVPGERRVSSTKGSISEKRCG
ncbi:MAG: imidazoleglycerol-phosphate dehydratase HisB [Methanomicrobiales archaeon]